ncbi:SMC-Scp complex subunit ScpB [Archaeoglobales archaeon]|nr:MAG: SMC-Scp complex subunit ScpB [Archaeoglobales archaeon]
MKVKRIVEAVLFSSTDALTPNAIAKISSIHVDDVKTALNELIEEYETRDSALEIVKIGNKYLMRVKPEYYPYVEKFVEKDLDKGSLRTLAVIAFKQPIMLSKLAKIRGNKCYEHVKKLKEMGLIRAEKKGKSSILTTTKEFAIYFGLKSDKPEDIKEFLKNYAKKDAKLEEYFED